MNNKNTKIKIASVIEDIFLNCDIKERDKYIVKKYHHFTEESLKMKELGDEFGITKEAVRIILEKNTLKIESSAGSVAHIFDSICKQILKVAPVSYNRLQSLALSSGFDLEGLSAKSLVAAVSIFSRKHKDKLAYHSFGDDYIIFEKGSSDLVTKIEKVARLECSKNGFANTADVAKKSSTPKIKINSQSVTDVLTCIKGSVWISKRHVTFIDSRNKVLTRVKKIAAFRDVVSTHKACDAINQSISHRDKNFKDLAPSALVKIIQLCINCKIVDSKIHFLEKPNIALSEIEKDIYNLLLQKPSLELIDIENLIGKNHSKAAIYQACSLSPLIVKNRKHYSVV